MDIDKLINDIFQFPPPRGGELWPGIFPCTTMYFNSRPREGANIQPATSGNRLLNFNSRPREGANEFGSYCWDEKK